MSLTSENPIVKETAQKTLGELVNCMLYLVDSLPSMVKEDDENHMMMMTKPHFSGFSNQLDGIRAAVESAFTQYGEEHSSQRDKIAELEQKLTKTKAN